jgi:hypothetical protein
MFIPQSREQVHTHTKEMARKFYIYSELQRFEEADGKKRTITGTI